MPATHESSPWCSQRARIATRPPTPVGGRVVPDAPGLREPGGAGGARTHDPRIMSRFRYGRVSSVWWLSGLNSGHTLGSSFGPVGLTADALRSNGVSDHNSGPNGVGDLRIRKGSGEDRSPRVFTQANVARLSVLLSFVQVRLWRRSLVSVTRALCAQGGQGSRRTRVTWSGRGLRSGSLRHRDRSPRPDTPRPSCPSY
jgi:hypothetical protein